MGTTDIGQERSGSDASTVEHGVMMKATAEPQHRWLQRFVGDWTIEAEARDLAKPGSPPDKSTGTERVRPLGDLWIVAEGEGQMPDGTAARNIMTLGYDPQKRRFVGTWVGSMMAHLWVYDGALDADGQRLSLDTEGPSMKDDGTVAKYRETIEWRGDAHRVFTSEVRSEDGQWHAFMTAHYRRKH